MEFVLVGLILGTIAYLGYRYYTKSKAKAAAEAIPKTNPMHVPFEEALDFTDNGMDPSHDLMATKPGDMLHNNMDLEFANKIVVGVVTCKQSGSPAWLAVLLDDGVWLSFEPGVRSEFSRWKEIPRGEVKMPGGDQLEVVYGGVTYKRNDFGYATYVSAGDTGLRDSGELEFAEFRSPDGEQSLSFEKYDDNDFSLSVGESMLASALTRYPAGDTRVQDV